MTPPCSARPLRRQPMVSSATPACRNEPEKSSLVNAVVFFRKPSVLSEFDRSAEETIMFPIFPANAAKTVLDAARLACPGFCSTEEKSKTGALPENHSSKRAALSAFALAHAASSDFRRAASFTSSSRREAYSDCTSSNITKGFSGSPPRLAILFSNEAPASPNGIPWVEVWRS